MQRTLYSGGGLLLLAAAFLSFTIFNNLFLTGARFDLTENRLYTLSDGSREIIESIEEPVNLYFFYSDQTGADLTSLRTYADRVVDLLQEYELRADGMIKLHVIDPVPFSEDEELAAEFGLQSVSVNTAGDSFYFGLAATNALDQQGVIPFFQPDKEAFLEYDVSSILQGLTQPDKPVLGLMSGLEVRGSVDPQTYQPTPAWFVIEQLEQSYEIESLDVGDTVIPSSVDVLLLIHPKGLSQATLFAIDQFVMNGGHLMAFVDPLAESDRPAAPMNQMAPTDQSSDLDAITSAWGVTLRDEQILGDAGSALNVQGPSGRPARHLGILGFGRESLATDDVVTAQLESLNVATAGIFEVSHEQEGMPTATPLAYSTTNAMPLGAMTFSFLSDPEMLQRGFVPTGERYPVALRLSGAAASAFPDGVDGADGEPLASTESMNVILVADTDMLTDRLWVRLQNFFGRRLASPFANNGDFVVNALDNLAGSSALISVRSRGRFSRPFEVVDDLRRDAESRYRQNEEDLQTRLNETEAQLAELQATRSEQGVLMLSPEQERALLRFQEEKLRIRKELRNVRHQLDKDIKALGGWLKFVNIALMPILLTLVLFAANYLRLSRRPGVDGGAA